MTENKFRDEDFVLFVDDYRDSFSVVMDRYKSFFGIDFHSELVHFFISLVVVSSIDKHFVEYFVETRGVSDFFVSESGLVFGEDPFLFFGGFYSTDIGVRPEKNMLERGFLLIDLLNCFILLHFGQ